MLAFLQLLWDIAIKQLTEEWQGIIVAGVLGIVAFIGRAIVHFIQDVWKARSEFGLTGFWVGECELPSYQQPKLEVWRYTQRGDAITLRFFDYDKDAAEVFAWSGGGVLRGDLCSMYYYTDDSQRYDSGVLLLRLKGQRLEGIYAQYDPNDPKDTGNSLTPFVSNFNQGTPTTPYRQFRVMLPVRARVRMAMGKAPFKTYKQVERIFEKIKQREYPPSTTGG